MWNEFNIKTFPAETAVFRDGVFCPELSTIGGTDINQEYTRPVHIIYVGEIAGERQLNININMPNQDVLVDVRIKNKKPAFLNIFIKNTGKNSACRGHILLENYSDLKYKCTAVHDAPATMIVLKTNLFAGKDSHSVLDGTAIIEHDCPDTDSDIAFSAMADVGAKIEFLPAQEINSVPNSADHSASIFTPTLAQIEYLRGAGLSKAEVNDTMRQAFMNDFSLF